MIEVKSNFKFQIPYLDYDDDEKDAIDEIFDIIRKDLLDPRTFSKIYRFSIRKETILSIFLGRITSNKVFINRMEWTKYSEEYSHLRNIEEKVKFRIPYQFYDEDKNILIGTNHALDAIKKEFLATGSVEQNYRFYAQGIGQLSVDIGSVVSKTIFISKIVLLHEKKILENPNPLLEKHFGLNSHHYLAGWITFIQKVMELDLTEKVSLIRQHRLGKVLSYCAKLKGDNEGQILGLAYQMIDAMANYYFFKSDEWRKGVRGLENSEWTNPQLKRVVNSFEHLISDRATVVFAQDSSQNSLSIARSGRMWSFKDEKMLEWRRVKEEIAKELPGQKLRFPLIVTNDIKMRLLTSVVQTYVKFFRSKNWQERISRFTDLDKTQRDFVNTLINLFSSDSDFELNRSGLNVLHNYHPSALPSEKWKELYRLAAEEISPIPQRMLLNIVIGHESTDQEAVAMALTHLPCGEVKIALDRCLNAYTAPYKTTLGSQLKFAAYQITQGGVCRLDICTKCRQTWPAFEALYWSIAESGLNMDIIAKMNMN